MTILPERVLRCTKGTSDKIWGMTKTKTNYYTFWGKVNGTIAFKSWDLTWDAGREINNLSYQKQRKGYAEVGFENLPWETQEKYEQALVMATLGLLRVK